MRYLFPTQQELNEVLNNINNFGASKFKGCVIDVLDNGKYNVVDRNLFCSDLEELLFDANDLQCNIDYDEQNELLNQIKTAFIV